LEDLRRARSQFEGGTVPAAMPASADPAWWWRFHQVAVSCVYGLLLIPLWMVRERLAPGPLRDVVFFGALAAAVVSIMLRLHASFLAVQDRGGLEAARPRVRAAVVAADLVLVALLACSALIVLSQKPGLAALLLSAALGALVTLLVIEPATARAAFPQRSGTS
jgi:hypothetical protein